MLDPKKLFGNFFADDDITSPRLSDFAAETVSLFRANDHAGRFTSFTSQLIPAQAALALELSDVSGAVALRKAKTATVDAVMGTFKSEMSDLESQIARAFGSNRQSEGYLSFYPSGVTEYSKVTKTQMPTLVKRVSDMATLYNTTLGTALTTLLKSFEGTWKAARNAQQDKKGTVSDNRNQRTAAREVVELLLLQMVHQVASAFPGDVAQCSSYFNFSRLDAPRNSSLERPDAPPAP